MSTRERRIQKEIEYAEQVDRENQERWRKESLSMHDRIQESDASDDVKKILEMIAEAAGIRMHEEAT